jgi:hypothetical protein
VQHILKSVLDSTQRWSKTDIAPLFELRFQWMTTRWKGNFINFSIELYFNICSVLYRGEIREKETARRWWEQERGDGDENVEEKSDQWLQLAYKIKFRSLGALISKDKSKATSIHGDDGVRQRRTTKDGNISMDLLFSEYKCL